MAQTSFSSFIFFYRLIRKQPGTTAAILGTIICPVGGFTGSEGRKKGQINWAFKKK